MIKQNIKIALCAILGLVVLWLITFCFIKIDVSAQTSIIFDGETPIVYLNNRDASYVENHKRSDKIRFYYSGSYQYGELINPEVFGDWTSYILQTNIKFDVENPIPINLILDSLNVYQYLTKK